ncbi:MAG: hypothetical protein IPO80_08200 [Propionibacteriaceae bacterium]|nr:hypothetical protein [Propionibacteriaceae bacterium]
MQRRLARGWGWVIGTVLVTVLWAPSAQAETPADAGGDPVLGWVMVIVGSAAAIGAFIYMAVKKRSMPPPVDGDLVRLKRH